jgi:internalin A
MKQILLMIAVVVIPSTGCISTQPRILPTQAIDEIIRDAVNRPNGEISRKDYQGIQSLILLDKEIDDLQAMRVFIHAENLAHLNLYDNQISNLIPISRLDKLRWLNLGRNQVIDLTPLKGLAQLKNLYIYENPNLSLNQIEELQKALPKCEIRHNAKK